ncbi:hypothetical protein R1flu_019841 [Riccia fluitans]|uniref:Semialdehyde dehydrogenase NAD-binding domain-containing protein n=1 Tax=Riccia fluitans TaxID=41844 RepID=A0ABD1ZJU4_9MARC
MAISICVGVAPTFSPPSEMRGDFSKTRSFGAVKASPGVLPLRKSGGSTKISCVLEDVEVLKTSGKNTGVVRIGVLGASGYTGSEIVRLLATHPAFAVTLMTADRKAGQSLASVFPHLITQNLPDMVAVKDADFSNVDAIFCCLPHGTTQEIIAALPSSLKVVDLSADFRLKDTAQYEKWYNGAHRAPELQKEAVYGLTELHREEVRNARLVANPGCYPTSIQLPLVPLLQAGLISKDGIIIDAKSGVSGAGRAAKEANLYTEIAEGMKSYGLTSHRHVPEIEQGLTEAIGSQVTVSFTPHLIPMTRGMQSTIYVQMTGGITVDDLRAHLQNIFNSEEFVCITGCPGRAIIVSTSTHLVKGASGLSFAKHEYYDGLARDQWSPSATDNQTITRLKTVVAPVLSKEMIET